MKVRRIGMYLDTSPGDDGKRTRWTVYAAGKNEVIINVSQKIGTHYCMACNSETCRHAEAVRKFRQA